MDIKKILHVVFVISFPLYLAFFAFATESTEKQLKVEDVIDPLFLSRLNTPRFVWLNTGRVLLLDSRVEASQRTLEMFDPQTGKRTPAIESAKVLSALENELGEKAPRSLSWPEAIDLNGRAVAYLLGDDVFTVEFSTSAVKRLTKTDSAETSLTFSPDGAKLGFLRQNDIYIVDWRSGEEKRMTTGATESLMNGPLSWVYWEEIYDHTDVPYSWSPDSTAIAYLQTDDSPVSISTYVHFKPATQGVVRQRYPKAGQENPKVKLGIVDVASAETTWIDCGMYEYLARFTWLPNSQEIAVQTLNRQQNELKLYFADRMTGKSREVLVEKQPCWINLNDTPYFFKDGKRFIWISERDGYQHLYLYGLDGRLITQLTKGEFMVCSSEGALVSRNAGLAGVDEKKGWVYFTSNKEALKERHLYRVKLDGKETQRLSSGNGVHAVVFSPDMLVYLDTFSNVFWPQELSLHRSDGFKISTITASARDLLEQRNYTGPEFRTFKTEDGLDLSAMVFMPAAFGPDKKYPVIIYVYGGPGSQQVVDRWSSRLLWHSLLAQQGFFVFVVEVRAGMGKSKATETSVYKRTYGVQNVKDILDGVKWIKQMPYIDRERIGLWGGSGGGCTTLYTMTHSDVFKAGISLYPVSDWYFYDTIYTERYQSTPQDNPEGYKETSSVLAAGNLKGRLLIVHGTYDDNVHPQNTEAFIDALVAKNIPFDLMIYPWQKHGIADYPARVHLHTLMLDFWKRNL